MIDMHSKYDNMQKNEMFYDLIFTNTHVIISISCMLSEHLEFGCSLITCNYVIIITN